MKTALIFVYGTLRPGEYNHWVGPATRDIVEDVTTQGEMYQVGNYDSFPVADFDAPGTITGTLLTMDIGHRLFRQMMAMEAGAGYEPRDVEVTLEDGSTVMATAFHWPQHYDRGPLIPGGNWKTRHDEVDA